MAAARDSSVDLARGLATLLMIQTHAFDGWIASELRLEPAFRWTRWLGTFPLPAFLLLAGVSVALKLGVSAPRSGLAGVRSKLARRGAGIAALGYAVNAAWALLDGARGLDTWLRADALHVIGLSLVAVCALIVVRVDGGLDVAASMRRGWVALIAIGIVTPWLARLSEDAQGAWRYVLAPISHVRGVSVMPVLPLASWCALGFVIGLWRAGATDAAQRERQMRALGVIGLLCMLVFGALTTIVSRELHEPLSRTSYALWPNVVEGAGRGLCILWCGAWLTHVASPSVQRALARFGTASLWIYVLHVPFCYGRLAGSWRASSTWPTALIGLLALFIACYGVSRFRSLWRDATR